MLLWHGFVGWGHWFTLIGPAKGIASFSLANIDMRALCPNCVANTGINGIFFVLLCEGVADPTLLVHVVVSAVSNAKLCKLSRWYFLMSWTGFSRSDLPARFQTGEFRGETLLELLAV